MDSKQVIKWIETNFLDVRVYESRDGGEVGQGITVDWDAQKNHASYLSFTDNEGKLSKKIIVWDFDEDHFKVLALLHELGHHTENQQEGKVVYNEIQAWKGCFKWYKHLGLEITKDLLYKASTWLSSYLKVYGYSEDNNQDMKDLGMYYTKPETVTDITESVVPSIVPELYYPTNIDDTSSETNPSFKIGDLTKPLMFGKESWKKSWR